MEGEQTELSLEICVGSDGGREGYEPWPQNHHHHDQEGTVHGAGSCPWLPAHVIPPSPQHSEALATLILTSRQRGWVQ